MSKDKSATLTKLFKYDENVEINEEESATGATKVILTNKKIGYRSLYYDSKRTFKNHGNSSRGARESLAQEYIMRNDLSQLSEFKFSKY